MDRVNEYPATVSRAGMIYMDFSEIGWKPLMESWIQSREDDQARDTLRRLTEKFMDRTLAFKKESCLELVPVHDLSAVRAFCNLFDAVATIENGVDSDDPEGYERMLELWYLFSIIWSLGASVTDESRKKFDMFLRELEGQFPSKDTVYEYSVDKTTKSWVPWDNALVSGWRYNSALPFYKVFVPTLDTIRNEFILTALININIPILLVGDVGTGKTSMIQSILTNQGDSRSILLANMSAQTSSNALQEIIESKLEKRTKNVFVPIGGKSLITFVDDFNMPMKDTFGSQPPLELIRHWMDYGFFYDRQKQTIKYVNDILLLAAMGTPGKLS
jgi:dynein heavy chain